jgi:hypothetical protein
VAECLPSKLEAFSSTPTTRRKKKKKEGAVSDLWGEPAPYVVEFREIKRC